MTELPRAVLALLACLVLAFAVSACGDDEDEGDGGSGGGDTAQNAPSDGKLIEKDPANAGKSLKLGSKNFAEQYIVSEIYAQALRAAGFRTSKPDDLGAEQVAYKSLKRGDVDAYPEYTGTALTSFFRVKIADVPRDQRQAYERARKELADDKITAMPPTPFQNTYVVASTKSQADETGNPKTLSELVAKVGNGVRLSGFPECRQRSDCLLGLKSSYEWSPRFVSSDGKFADLDAGQADYTMGFGTDGELAQTNKYASYADDKKLFPPYNLMLLVRDDAVGKLGASGRKVIEEIQKPLTEQVMRELNSRVTQDKKEPASVAKEYLQEAGFVAK